MIHSNEIDYFGCWTCRRVARSAKYFYETKKCDIPKVVDPISAPLQFCRYWILAGSWFDREPSAAPARGGELGLCRATFSPPS